MVDIIVKGWKRKENVTRNGWQETARRLVKNAEIFVHFDIFSWSSNTKPAMTIGALMQGVRALYTAIEEKMSNR